MTFWDHVRKHCPNMRATGPQVFMLPFDPLRDTPEGYGKAAQTVFKLLPENDVSWIRPPFEQTVMVAPGGDGCLLVTMHDLPEELPDGIRADWMVSVDVLRSSPDGGVRLIALALILAGDRYRVASLPEEFLTEALPNRAAEIGCSYGFHWGPHMDPAGTVTVRSAAVMRDMAWWWAYVVMTAFGLLSCKNVRTVIRDAPRQQRRASQREGLPLVSWHELQIVPGQRSSGGGGAGDGLPLALHWVRGHFKDYREKGLFGAAKGVYWWSPHLAGKADRVVLKDYVLNAPSEA